MFDEVFSVLKKVMAFISLVYGRQNVQVIFLKLGHHVVTYYWFPFIPTSKYCK